MYCSVVLLQRMLEPLTYQIRIPVAIGAIVQVPLGRQSCTGMVIALSQTSNYHGKVREILEVVDPKPFISDGLMNSLRFMSGYYFCPLALCLKLAIPSGLLRSGTCFYVLGSLPACSEPEPQKENSNTASGDVENIKRRSLFDETSIKTDSRDIFLDLWSRLSGEMLGEGRLSEGEIRRRCKLDAKQFQSCVLSGLLKPIWTLEKARAKETKEAVYTLVEGEKRPRLGAKQKAILAWLESQNGSARHSAVLAQFGACTQVLHRLEELGMIAVSAASRDKTSFDNITPIVNEVERTQEQNDAIEAVLRQKGFGGFLLFGVTGSGKTEVYLGVMEAVRKRGQSCIFILPEIALTPQFCAVFKGRFGNDVAVLHSGLGEHERFDTWSRIREGRIGIVIGPRSVLFSPVQNLGLIVIDEEHDQSFKQEEAPRYHARDMALYLGQQSDCPVILGSATPSLESYCRAMQAHSTLLQLTRRPCARPMPNIQIIDMRDRLPEDAEDGGGTVEEKLRARLFSSELLAALKETYERHEQAIIFLNRRGYANYVQCEYCGHALYCPNCDVALTYYKYANALRCHYCDYTEPLVRTCPKCGRESLNYTGYGTERMVDMLSAAVPGARVERLDRERASTKALQTILDDFRTGKIDILVGTQMVAKGHDIHNVTLVGIINADMSLHIPDFRSSERTYQLLMQVSGRAGRGMRPGRVILQTLKPDHPAIQGVVKRDYASFAAEELALRRVMFYPPFAYLILVGFEGENQIDVENYAVSMGRIARGILPGEGDAVVLGPAPAPIVFLRGKARYQMYLRCKDRRLLHRWFSEVWRQTAQMRQEHQAVRCTIDVDPYNMM